MVVEVTVRDIIDRGVPFLVAKVVPRGLDCESVEAIIKPMLGKTMRLDELLLSLVQNSQDVRVGTVFDPDDWANYYTWSEYSYPAKTLVREAGDMQVEVKPYNKETHVLNYVYTGIPILCVIPHYIENMGLTYDVKPVAIAFFTPLITRRTAVMLEEEPHHIKAYVANPEARTIFREHGFIPINGYSLEKSYINEEEMAEDLLAIDRKLVSEGYETYMLKGLRRRVKRLAKATA